MMSGVNIGNLESIFRQARPNLSEIIASLEGWQMKKEKKKKSKNIHEISSHPILRLYFFYFLDIE